MFWRFHLKGWFWGDPHFKTLDGGNFTFNGLGEYVMIDAQNGTFQLQARTSLAQGNSTTATIFAAGAAKEESTSAVEVRVKKGGTNWAKNQWTLLPAKKFFKKVYSLCRNSFASWWNFFESKTHDAGVTKSLHLGDDRLFVMEVPVRFSENKSCGGDGEIL